jgi:competence protein ComEC
VESVVTLVYLALAWLAGIALGATHARPSPVWLACALAGAVAALLGRRERGWVLGGALLGAAGLGALRVTLSPLYATPLQPLIDGPPITLTGVVAAAPQVRATRTEIVLAVDGVGGGGEVASPPQAVDGVGGGGEVTSPPQAVDGVGGRGEVASPPQAVDGVGGGGEVTSPLPLPQGKVLLRVARESPYRYGDRLQVTGELRTPTDTPGFSYRAYLARRGIHALVDGPQIQVLARDEGHPVQAALIALADRAEALVATLWPAPESALMAGILLGRERNIPDRLLTAFNDSGTRHIIAISGFNITLLAGALSAILLTITSRRAAAPIVIILLAFYTLLVGGDAAVVRAAIMGALTLLALLAGRPADALTGLGTSAWLMTAWHPWTLWEPSFQLSFAATLGLITLEPRLESWVERVVRRGTEGTGGTGGAEGTDGERRVPSVPLVPSVPPVPSLRVPGWLREALLVSLAAQIATLPITLGTFGRLSLIAPLANLLILPVQAAVMELGALAVVLGLLWRPLGQLFAHLAWPFIAYTIAVTEALGSLSWAAVDFHLAGALPLALYSLAGFLLWARSTPERWQALARHLPTKALLVGLAAAAAIIWVGVARGPDGRLHVTILDVGQGDAILVRTPDGKWLLVDGGPDPTLLPAALGRRLAPWDRHLHLVALTHPDEDHLAGLVRLPRTHRLGLVLDTRNPRDTPSGQAWAGNTAGLHVLYPERGTILDLGSGARLEVLHPAGWLLEGTRSDSNNNSLVLRLTYGRASFLLTGDLELEGELHLLAQEDLPLDSTVLKVSHHGARTATTLRFLEAVTPQLAVVSAGAGNRYGHPHPDVLARLEEAGALVWRTDGCGDVHIATDGERLWVRTGRPCLASAGD